MWFFSCVHLTFKARLDIKVISSLALNFIIITVCYGIICVIPISDVVVIVGSGLDAVVIDDVLDFELAVVF